jgi:hypothetical protein
MLRVAVRPLLLAGLLIACGGKSFENDGERDGGSASGGSDDAGSGGRGGDNGGSSSGGSSSGGATSSGGFSSPGGTGSGGFQCMQTNIYDEPGGSIPVRVRNGTSRPIYLGRETPDCGFGVPFQVADASGQPLHEVPLCQATCQQLQLGAAVACPPIVCALPSVVALDPGGSTLTMWDGLYAENVTLLLGCRERIGQDECTRVASAVPGDYVFSAQAGSSMQCLQPLDAGNCGACMKDSNGACTTTYAVIGGPLHQAKVSVKLDGSYGLGEQGGGDMVREVVIEFED